MNAYASFHASPEKHTANSCRMLRDPIATNTYGAAGHRTAAPSVLGPAYLLVEVSDALFCFFETFRVFFFLLFVSVWVWLLPDVACGFATARMLPKLARVNNATAVLIGFSSLEGVYPCHPTRIQNGRERSSAR
jgi:hypothetical protein